MYLDIRRNNIGFSNALFNRLAFAITATSKDDLKPALQNVLIEKNRIVGCDGRRVHITEGDVGDIKPGQYWPVRITKTSLVLVGVDSPDEYPNIDKTCASRILAFSESIFHRNFVGVYFWYS